MPKSNYDEEILSLGKQFLNAIKEQGPDANTAQLGLQAGIALIETFPPEERSRFCDGLCHLVIESIKPLSEESKVKFLCTIIEEIFNVHTH